MNVQDKSGTWRSLDPSVLLLLAVLGAWPMAAAADDVPDDDRFSVAVGAYFITRANGTIRLDDTSGLVNIGTSIDWERDLGGDTSEVAARVDGFYRFSPKHRVDISWYKFGRDGQRITQRDLSFGNVDFPAGSAIRSSLFVDTTKVAYTYSFYRAPEIEVALSFGLHVTKFSASLEASGLGLAEATSSTVPLPVFGFRLDYALSPKWWVRSKNELFFLDKANQYSGFLSDFSVALEHKTFRHVGFGFGFNRYSAEVEIDSDTKSGAFNTVTSGYMLYVVVR